MLNYSYQREKLSDVFDEMLPLLKNHYLEVAHWKDIEFDPDLEAYMKMDDAGFIRVYTARNEEKKLVGYNVFFIKSNLHYRSSLQATNDVIYIDPTYRGFGRDFINWCDTQLKSEGVQAVYHHVKGAHNWGPMIEKMGYELIDLMYGKRLDKGEA